MSCLKLAQPSAIALSTADDLGPEFGAEVDIVFVYEESVLNQLAFEQFDWISSRDLEINWFGSRIDVLSFKVIAGTKID